MVDVQTIGVLVTAASVSVAAIYYIMNLRVQQINLKRTLETRQADILQRHAQINVTQDFMDAWHDLYYNQNFLTSEEWRRDYGVTHPEHYTNFIAMIHYYEILGGLLRHGLVDIDLMEKIWQPLHIIIIWERVKPVIMSWREAYKNDSIYNNFEYLFDIYMKRHPEAELTRSVVKEHYAERNKRKAQSQKPS